MPLGRYLPALVVGGVMWAMLYSAIGVVGVDLVGRLYAYSPPLAIVALCALLGGYAWFVVRQSRRHARD
jgi:membrane protein DedA with SNARE-associated domain